VTAAPVIPPASDDGWLHRRVLYPMITTLLPDIYEDARKMEEDVRRSGTRWTIVRPPRLTDKPLTGRYRTAIEANPPRAYTISRADVAHAMLAALEDPATIGKAIGVAN